MQYFWEAIDSILTFVNVPITVYNEIALVLFLFVLLGFALVLLVLVLFPGSYYGKRSHAEVLEEEPESTLPKEAEDPYQKRKVRVLLSPEVRSRVRLYKPEDLNSKLEIRVDKVDDEFVAREPYLLGTVVEFPEEGDVLFIGNKDRWGRFSNPENLSDSAKKHFYFSLEEERAEDEPWIWEGIAWDIVEDIEPLRAKVEGNHYLSGNELVHVILMEGGDSLSDAEEEIARELFLVLDIGYTGGRGNRDNKVVLWSAGKMVDKEVVDRFKDEKLVISHPMMEAAMY